MTPKNMPEKAGLPAAENRRFVAAARLAVGVIIILSGICLYLVKR